MCLKTITWLVLMAFILNLAGYSSALAEGIFNLPEPGRMVLMSPSFEPALIKGLKFYPENPFQFDFIIDMADEELDEIQFKETSEKLIKYFLASLTVPEEDLWVNLSPYEKDKIIPEVFGVTEMGRDLLLQDYILKQLTASLIYPEDALGKQFWARIYAQAGKLYGTSDIPLDILHKVWIVPDRAIVYEAEDTAMVVYGHLKVMLAEDYAALQNETPPSLGQAGDQVGTQLIREIILPEIEKEVNEGQNFAQLRQIYHSLILATWFKKTLYGSLLGKIYVDQNKVEGIDLEDKSVKEKIYEQYIEAFKKGVYNYIREEYDPSAQEVIARKYFSGGFMTISQMGETFVQRVIGVSNLKEIAGKDGFEARKRAARLVFHAQGGKVHRVESRFEKELPKSPQNQDAAMLTRYEFNIPLAKGKPSQRAQDIIRAINQSGMERNFEQMIEKLIELFNIYEDSGPVASRLADEITRLQALYFNQPDKLIRMERPRLFFKEKVLFERKKKEILQNTTPYLNSGQFEAVLRLFNTMRLNNFGGLPKSLRDLLEEEINPKLLQWRRGYLEELRKTLKTISIDNVVSRSDLLDLGDDARRVLEKYASLQEKGIKVSIVRLSKQLFFSDLKDYPDQERVGLTEARIKSILAELKILLDSFVDLEVKEESDLVSDEESLLSLLDGDELAQYIVNNRITDLKGLISELIQLTGAEHARIQSYLAHRDIRSEKDFSRLFGKLVQGADGREGSAFVSTMRGSPQRLDRSKPLKIQDRDIFYVPNNRYVDLEAFYSQYDQVLRKMDEFFAVGDSATYRKEKYGQTNPLINRILLPGDYRLYLYSPVQSEANRLHPLLNGKMVILGYGHAQRFHEQGSHDYRVKKEFETYLLKRTGDLRESPSSIIVPIYPLVRQVKAKGQDIFFVKNNFVREEVLRSNLGMIRKKIETAIQDKVTGTQQAEINGTVFIFKVYHSEKRVVVLIADVRTQIIGTDGKVKPHLHGYLKSADSVQSTEEYDSIELTLEPLMNQPGQPDAAMVASPDTKGGIALDPVMLQLEIQKNSQGQSGSAVFEFQDLQNIPIEGLFPIIIRITPLESLPILSSALNRVFEQDDEEASAVKLN